MTIERLLNLLDIQARHGRNGLHQETANRLVGNRAATLNERAQQLDNYQVNCIRTHENFVDVGDDALEHLLELCQGGLEIVEVRGNG